MVEIKQNIYIKMKAFDHSLLDECIYRFVDYLRKTGAELSGPVALPKRNFRFIVNKSPHVDKKSREQFGMETSERLIVLRNPTPTIVQMLQDRSSQDLSFPAGVEVDLKIKEVQ